jgi:uncharacterized protein (TIGR00369 family)
MSARDVDAVDRLAANPELPAFFPYLGMSVLRATSEEGVVRMQVPDVLRGPFGPAHGGAIAALIDTALGVAVACRMSPRDRTATHELNINYISFATEAVVIATARVIRMGQSVAHAEAEARTESGTLIAKALATFGVFRDKNV